MSPRTEKQNKEIRKEKQVIIMNAALELFSVDGFENTTINQIAKRAGISKGLMYSYFESKEDLLETTINNGLDEMFEIFDPNKDGVLEVHEFEFFITETFKTLRENRNFWRLYYTVYIQPAVFKIFKKKIDNLIEPYMRLTVNYFTREGFENPQMEAILFGALIDGIYMDYLLKPDFIPLDDIRDELIKRYCKRKK